MSGPTNFEQLGERLLLDDSSPWTADEYQRAMQVVARYLRPLLSSQEDAEDVASEVMIRFLKMQADGDLDSERNIGGYLRRAAQWKAMDYRRSMMVRAQKEMSLDQSLLELSGDDDVAQAFDERATADLIRRALARAREAGDRTAYSVVTTVLDEVDRTGSRPSNRAVGAQLKLSHSGVAKALERFRTYLEEQDQD